MNPLRVGTVTAVVLASSLFTTPGHGHEEDDPRRPKERTRAPTYDPSEFRSNQVGAFEFRVGPYRPRVDAEFDGSATPFEDLFGTGPSIAVGLEGDWQAIRIPHFGSIGPGIGWNFVTYAADALKATDPSERVGHPTTLWIMPMYAVGVLRVDVLARDFRIPIVPYVKGGFSLSLWEASDAGSTSDAGGLEGRGLETGLQFQVGGMLHLNFFARQRALDMDNSTGVNHAYLFAEWLISDVDSFDRGLQTGTSTFVAGVAVEF